MQKAKELTGEYVTIDLTPKDEKPRKKPITGSLASQISHKRWRNEASLSCLEKNLNACINALARCVYFSPGGVVGKHGLFTLLENELRNVKHFEEERIEEMRETWLECSLDLYAGSPSRNWRGKVNCTKLEYGSSTKRLCGQMDG